MRSTSIKWPGYDARRSMPENVFHLPTGAGDLDRDPDLFETSSERFDRAAFARRALDLIRPDNTTVAVCEGAGRLRLESGRVWGRGSRRWALLAVSPCASRRAIALAVANLARGPREYALDVLLHTSSAAAVT
jgi:hypothetical protein